MKHLVYIITLLLLASCKTIQYVPVETVHTEYKDHYIHDSIYVERNDSSVTIVKNDTVTVEHWKIRYRDRFTEVVDTFIKTDSIQVPYPVPAQLTQWQKFYCDYGKIMLGVTLACIIGLLIFITEWIRKRTS